MLEYDFQNSPGHWICLTAHLYKRAMNEELTRCGITFRQCEVLANLALVGSITQVELAERMNIEPPTLVRVLDRMERDGLVERIDCEQDRRRKFIRPRPKAKPVWKKIVGCASKVRARAHAGLSEKELATLRKLVRTISENLERSVVSANHA